jgi:hypothetical protein
MIANRKIVAQPEKVIALELLPADQRVEEVHDDEHRDDEPEEVRAAHIRSIASTNTNSATNMMMPSAIARMSMRSVSDQDGHGFVTKHGVAMTIS